MRWCIIDNMNGCSQDLSEYACMKTDFLASKHNRVGLLGGTFNPVHCGHISMATISLYEFSLGEVIFLPLGLPPHKHDAHIASATQRLEMVRLAIAQEPRFSLSSIETSRSGYTYTVDTMELLTQIRRDTIFFYIIGADTLFELPTWKKYERVFLLTDFICILRPGQDDIRVRQFADELNRDFGHKIHIASERGPCISSSQIRELAAARQLPDGLVPEAVAQFIKKNSLYIKEV